MKWSDPNSGSDPEIWGGGVVFKVRSTQIRTKVLAPIFWRNLKVRPREVDPLLENIKAKSEAT